MSTTTELVTNRVYIIPTSTLPQDTGYCEIYESKVQETTLNPATDYIVEAILEDALGGKTNYAPKYY